MYLQGTLRVLHVVAVCAAMTAACMALAEESAPPVSTMEQFEARPARPVSLVEPGPRLSSTLYADGSKLEVATEVIWRPFCGIGTATTTQDELIEMARSTRELRKASRQSSVGGSVRVPGKRDGFDIVFNYVTTPPAEAEAALAEIETYMESQFDDPVTVVIELNFTVLAPNVLGSTAAVRIPNVAWNTVATAIQADMDGDDLIQVALPSSVVPVRYDASTADVTGESLVTLTHSLYQATVGTLSGSAATVTINSNFNWDYSPPEIDAGKHCFQSVVIHEIGHVLGFVSRADFDPNSRIELLDVFRFQRTDGTGNWNPDTLLDLTLTARTVDYNNLNDDANTDLILDEYRMADGSPDQASHFRSQQPGICLMDPSLAAQETFYPNFLRSCDLAVFDAIGWDRVGTAAPPLVAPYPHNRPKNRYISFDPNPANSGIPVAFLVRINELELASCDGNGARCRLDRGDNDCKTCSVSGSPCGNSSGCPLGESCGLTGETCVNDLAHSVFDFETRTWWVGPPDAHGIAHLVSRANRHVSANWPTVVHVGDCEIVPQATYGVRTYDLTDLSESELLVETIARPGSNYWADVVGPRSFYCDADERNELCDPENNACPMGQPCEAMWPASNGVTNFDDVTATLFAFQAAPWLTLPDIKSVDLHGNEMGDAWVDPPNYVANLADIQFIVMAFQGSAYPFVDPANCPDVP